MWIKGSLRNLPVLDVSGRPAGRVEDTLPADGSSPEFVVLRLGRFGQRAMVPVAGARSVPDGLQVPFTRPEIEESPTPDAARFQDDRLSIARAYWSATGR